MKKYLMKKLTEFLAQADENDIKQLIDEFAPDGKAEILFATENMVADLNKQIVAFLDKKHGKLPDIGQVPPERIEDFYLLTMQISVNLLSRSLAVFSPERRREELDKICETIEAGAEMAAANMNG